VLIDKNKLFSKYINIPLGQRLKEIIAHFENFIGILNICGAINRTHIPLVDLPNKKVTFDISDFFNRKKFHSVVLQFMCDADKIFWNICVGQLGKVHDGGQFKRSNLYAQLRSQEIFQKLVVIIQNMRCTPFLIGDATYPICTYLQKNWKTCNLADVDPNGLCKPNLKHLHSKIFPMI
jgi:hypothetical protein